MVGSAEGDLLGLGVRAMLNDSRSSPEKEEEDGAREVGLTVFFVFIRVMGSRRVGMAVLCEGQRNYEKLSVV